MEKGFYIKGIDEKLYRELKAEAARRGVPLYSLLNDAIRFYLNMRNSLAIETEEDVNNRVYMSLVFSNRFKGKWVVICMGKVLGFADSWDKAVEIMRKYAKKNRVNHGIVAKIGEKIEEEVEILGSTFKMF